ncbi:universal stress protein, partial [Streptomyces chiangmaiensis]
MEQAVIACVDDSANDRAVVRWAEQEASLRGLPLREVHGAVPYAAKLVVAGVQRLDTAAFSACPVVLVPPQPDLRQAVHPVAEIVLGLNAREPAAGAVDFACETARLWDVRLRAVHAWQLPPCAAELPFGVPEEDRGAWEDQEVQLLADALRPWREKCPELHVLADVRLFTPAQALLQGSASAGLVVVGRGLRGGPGTVAPLLLRDARCPVAVVSS